jgi:cysteine synthase
VQVAQEVEPDQLIVTIFPDTGERYFSLEAFFQV